MANYRSSVNFEGASACIAGRGKLLVLATAMLLLAGCAAPHPAPIVRHDSVGRAAPPIMLPPARAAAPGAPPTSGAPGTTSTPASPDAAPMVETTPIAPSNIEARPLGSAAAPANLLKTEPNALKRPYSDALLAQLQAAQPDAPPVLAIAPATAPPAPAASAPSSPSAPASPAASAPATAPEASASGFIWPASGPVMQDAAQPRSMGLSISGKPGDPIVAASDGRVIFSGPGPRGYGNLLIVKHGDGMLSVYGHNRTLLVKEGQNVKRGQQIAELGSSGADRPQLHFELRNKEGKPVDPRKYLPNR